MRHNSRMLLLMFLLSFLGITQAQDDIEAFGRACVPVLVPDELKQTFSNDDQKSFRDAVCGNWYNSHKEDVEGHGGVDVIDIVNVGGGGGSSTQQVSKGEFCSHSEYQASTKTISNFWSRIVPADARQKWLECMTQYSVTHVRPQNPVAVTASDLSNNVLVTTKWADTTIPQPKLVSVETVGLSCPDGRYRNRKITGVGVTLNCAWASKFVTDGAVIVHAKNTSGAFSSFASVRRTLPIRGAATLELTDTADRVDGTKDFCSPFVSMNNDWHNASCDPGRCRVCLDRWCGEYVSVSLKPEANYTLAPNTLHVGCQDNQGSCGWNEAGNIGRLIIRRSDQNEIDADRALGSRKIAIQLCAKENHHTNAPETTPNVQTWTLHDGLTFAVQVPANNTGMLRVHWANGSDESLSVGNSTDALKALHTDSDGGRKAVTYLVVPRS